MFNKNLKKIKKLNTYGYLFLKYNKKKEDFVKYLLVLCTSKKSNSLQYYIIVLWIIISTYFNYLNILIRFI